MISSSNQCTGGGERFWITKNYIIHTTCRYILTS